MVSKHSIKKHLLEMGTKKSRPEEEKFFETFSNIQINVVLLFILSATFLTSGLLSYAEILGRIELINRWLSLIIFSILALIVSIYGISMAGILHSLRGKRIANMVSFVSFMFGASIFFVSLVILLIIFF